MSMTVRKGALGNLPDSVAGGAQVCSMAETYTLFSHAYGYRLSLTLGAAARNRSMATRVKLTRYRHGGDDWPRFKFTPAKCGYAPYGSELNPFLHFCIFNGIEDCDECRFILFDEVIKDIRT